MSIVSIIIRAFNEDRYIGRLLDGIARQEWPQGWTQEVILVDSGSTDSTVAIAKSMGATVIHIKKKEFSFGRALNVGCRQAMGDILLFASAHVYPIYTDWIVKMVSHFSDAKVALVYGRQQGVEVTRFSEHRVFAQWFPLESNYNQSIPFCNNANCAIRKSLWSDQPFDEYLTGLEDIDWAKRIMKKDYKIVYEAGALIAHTHEETSIKIKTRYQREAIALKRIMPNVRFNFWDFIKFFLSNSLLDSSHALNQGIFLREVSGIAIFRFMQFYGTYLGHNQSGEITRELKSRFYYPSGATTKPNAADHEQTSRKITYSDHSN